MRPDAQVRPVASPKIAFSTFVVGGEVVVLRLLEGGDGLRLAVIVAYPSPLLGTWGIRRPPVFWRALYVLRKAVFIVQLRVRDDLGVASVAPFGMLAAKQPSLNAVRFWCR